MLLHAFAETAFQACSFDHSDISPFRINRFASGPERCTAKPSFKSRCSAMSICIQCFPATPEIERSQKLCNTS